jgi:hypothetical protein
LTVLNIQNIPSQPAGKKKEKEKARKSKRKQQNKDENFDQDTPLTGNIRKSKHINKKQKETNNTTTITK